MLPCPWPTAASLGSVASLPDRLNRMSRSAISLFPLCPPNYWGNYTEGLLVSYAESSRGVPEVGTRICQADPFEEFSKPATTRRRLRK
jgi:hypothetical protein